MGIFSALTSKQKEAIGILQIGTFLEYFDLMIYVHMAGFLNELFFPKTDPHATRLLLAFSFCLTFIFRPFGALFFGAIGDTFGRKLTIVITTMAMAFCCITMAILPTYTQIGITAAWLLTICRIIQGMSSMGEIVGASIYVTELVKKPECYPAVSFFASASCLGGFLALAIGSGVITLGISWRVVFLFGALVAIVGTVARTALRETPEFANAKLQLENKLAKANMDSSVVLETDPIVNEKVNQKTSLAFFLLESSHPVWFYFVYMHCGSILKESFNYSTQQIIQHNLILAAASLLATLVYAYLSYAIYPLKILRAKLIIFSFVILVPYLLFHITTVTQLLYIQIFICVFELTSLPASAILFNYFPIFKRFKYVSFLYALARAIMYIIVSFGLVYLVEKFDNWGLLIVFIPIIIGFNFGISHFEKLEKAAGNYPLNLKTNLKIVPADRV
jgi:MFS family permease